VTGLHDPAARSPVRVALLARDLFSAGTDVWCEFLVFEQLADEGKVICLVEAESLGSVQARLGALDRDRVECSLQQEVIVAVGA
jgi:hypothetical protein